MKKHERGEIATIITIGTLVVIGLTTIVSSFFINQKKTTSSKAAEPISTTCTGSCTTPNAFCVSCMNPKEKQSCASDAGVSLVYQCDGGVWKMKYPECRTECKPDGSGNTSPPPGTGAGGETGGVGAAGCFHLDAGVDKIGTNKFNVSIKFVSDGGDGDIQLERDDAHVAGWNAWNKGVHGNYTYSPEWTGGAIEVGSGTKTVTYKGYAANSAACPGVTATLTCTFSADGTYNCGSAQNTAPATPPAGNTAPSGNTKVCADPHWYCLGECALDAAGDSVRLAFAQDWQKWKNQKSGNHPENCGEPAKPATAPPVVAAPPSTTCNTSDGKPMSRDGKVHCIPSLGSKKYGKCIDGTSTALELTCSRTTNCIELSTGGQCVEETVSCKSSDGQILPNNGNKSCIGPSNKKWGQCQGSPPAIHEEDCPSGTVCQGGACVTEGKPCLLNNSIDLAPNKSYCESPTIKKFCSNNQLGTLHCVDNTTCKCVGSNPGNCDCTSNTGGVPGLSIAKCGQNNTIVSTFSSESECAARMVDMGLPDVYAITYCVAINGLFKLSPFCPSGKVCQDNAGPLGAKCVDPTVVPATTHPVSGGSVSCATSKCSEICNNLNGESTIPNGIRCLKNEIISLTTVYGPDSNGNCDGQCNGNPAYTTGDYGCMCSVSPDSKCKKDTENSQSYCANLIGCHNDRYLENSNYICRNYLLGSRGCCLPRKVIQFVVDNRCSRQITVTSSDGSYRNIIVNSSSQRNFSDPPIFDKDKVTIFINSNGQYTSEDVVAGQIKTITLTGAICH